VTEANRARVGLVALNVVGGLAVLGSYALAFGYAPDLREGLWGGVPEAWKPLYQVTMVLAALGYFPFTAKLVLASTPESYERATGRSHRQLFLFYALVLVPSALWLPLTAAMLQDPSPALWWTIRAVLFAVAAGSLGILVACLRLARTQGGWLSGLAVAGAAAFCLQTVILDALVWPAFFEVPAP